MTQKKRVFSRREILEAMPQQPPFLFIDKVEIDGEIAVSTYTLKDNEAFFDGHFKGNPVMPGSIMLESLGQLCVFYLLKSEHRDLKGKKVDSSKIFFISCDSCRCTRLCRPGETFEIRSKLKRLRHPMSKFEAEMIVDGKRAAYAETITLTYDYLPE